MDFTDDYDQSEEEEQDYIYRLAKDAAAALTASASAFTGREFPQFKTAHYKKIIQGHPAEVHASNRLLVLSYYQFHKSHNICIFKYLLPCCLLFFPRGLLKN